ncbi:MAG: DUF488 family protein [Thermoplasmata archaeon]|nr:DUF488 family protein [Thermoplasmata archaeon]
MLKTKSVYERKEADDGLRVLVMREWPRGIEREDIDEWIVELSPSPELDMEWTGRRIEWDDYEKRYRREVEGQVPHLRYLKELSERKNVTLLCWEGMEDLCHRRVLRRMVEETKLQ